MQLIECGQIFKKACPIDVVIPHARSQEIVSHLLFNLGCRQLPWHSSNTSRACTRGRHFLNSQDSRRDRSDCAAVRARLELRSHRKRPLVSSEASTKLNAVLPKHARTAHPRQAMGEEQGEANRDWKQRYDMAEDMSSWFCQLSTQERLQVGQCCVAIKRG